MTGRSNPRQPVQGDTEARFQRTGAAPRPAEREARELDAVESISRTEAYEQLVARRHRFTLVAGGLFAVVFAAFVALAAWAHGWMGTRIVSGLTVGYLAALVVIVAVWVVAFAYSRASTRLFDPLAERAREEGGR
jgi:uncharacterized membrane protein (DUF485 family)